MTRVITQQSMENMEYVRVLLQEKQPGFSAALELVPVLAELELWHLRCRPETSDPASRGRERRNGPT